MADEVALELDLIDKLSPDAIRASKALEKFERRAKRAIKTTEKLKKAFDPKKGTLSQFAAHLERQNDAWDQRVKRVQANTKAHNKFRRSTTDVLGGLKGLAAAYVGVRTAQAAVTAGAQFFGAVVDKANFMQKARVSFEQLMGSQQAGERVWQTSQRLANQFGFAVEDTAERMRNFIAQGFKETEAETFNKLLADLQVVGVEGEKAQHIMFALTQIKSKGRLQAEELLQLAEAGVGLKFVKDQLQNIMGVDSSKLEKLQRTGKVDSDTALAAIKAGILTQLRSSEPGKVGEEFAARTLQGAMNAFKNAKANFLIAIADKAAPAFEKISTFLRGLATAFTSREAIDSFAKAFDRVGVTLDNIRPKVVEGLTTGLVALSKTFDRIMTVGPAFIEGFLDELMPKMGALNDLFKDSAPEGMVEGFRQLGAEAGGNVGTLIQSLPKLTSALERVASALDVVVGIVRIFNKGFAEMANTTGPLAGYNLVNGIGAGIDQAAPGLFEKVTGIADDVLAKFRSIWQIKSPSKVMKGFGSNLSKGLSMGVDSGGMDVAASAGMSKAIAAGAGMSTGLGGKPRSMTSNVTNNYSASVRHSNNIQGTGDPSDTAAAISLLGTDDMLSAFARMKPSAGVAFG